MNETSKLVAVLDSIGYVIEPKGECFFYTRPGSPVLVYIAEDGEAEVYASEGDYILPLAIATRPSYLRSVLRSYDPFTATYVRS